MVLGGIQRYKEEHGMEFQGIKLYTSRNLPHNNVIRENLDGCGTSIKLSIYPVSGYDLAIALNVK
jgi:hypothetical protein